MMKLKVNRLPLIKRELGGVDVCRVHVKLRRS